MWYRRFEGCQDVVLRARGQGAPREKQVLPAGRAEMPEDSDGKALRAFSATSHPLGHMCHKLIATVLGGGQCLRYPGASQPSLPTGPYLLLVHRIVLQPFHL